MASLFQSISHGAERKAVGALVDNFLKNLDKSENRAETYAKIVDMAKKYINDMQKISRIFKKYIWTKGR